MPIRHIVVPGEGVSQIAFRYGLAPESIWNDPENAVLREIRTHADVLLAGDVVFVRDAVAEWRPAVTGRKHVYRRKGVPARFRVRLCDGTEPWVNRAVELDVDGNVVAASTDADGWIVLWVAPATKLIALSAGGVVRYRFRVGHLDPISTPSGVAARLQNLGFLVAGADPEQALAPALRAFQRKHALDDSGERDDATLAKLAEVYGC